ncbi:1-deoxy-D-xylulose-5-phosphate synthase [Clostridium botulinum]|uniref:1-deoxy-D-xylulose-5-phosphate synthase n=2 Tax=Clostridium botulinum TaxID=1491 RepID=A0A846JF27_CLOBO|nr:1-deoxy-D-xylulose-5-phosphate synthase [Clostridium botulinum A3 str. Loch Maree]NFH66291.1 1-deoxy-D-xylulose-5-phosphate synthase [Clostridium botulinum]NFJ08774.1 1-deoxy-D-xylulose-5-phosphate synthase [Clostridium botulinum]NFK15170.1 1-deoxy-D-xylulose-5-phosphate synthase [Clostridium botulinum]NFM95284.1 1-deoxy-D-xylulose-5-phosphate synthase [Clostridium botulinum]
MKMKNILDKYQDFDSIKSMSINELNQFSYEIREFLIDNVSKTGGHLASNLGVVELTLSIFNVFDLNKDKIIWDVGHQAYVHKILTGRKDKFNTLRQYGGLSGFPKKCESPYDAFETGHSSTSISAALGMARARDIKGEDNKVIAVIGDGALTGGMAFEALNDLGFNKTDLIIILNDNQMSIAENVGGMSSYLSKVRLDPTYNKLKKEVNNTLNKIPNVGKGMARSLERVKNGIKQMIVPGMFFENLGIKYLGPIDGHDIKELSKVMKMAKDIKGPVLIHTITKKGKGYAYAEKKPDKFHSIGSFDCTSGEINSKACLSYSGVFGEELTKIGKEDKRVVAITAAMKDGTGLRKFAETFPKRFFDVGIAEQHAVTLAAGIATEGLKPVFAVYSTFLQRAYDQILHDICIQNLPVVFAIDRAGIVGSDGETHQGIFDLSYLSSLPNMTIIAPKCLEEMKPMLKWALNQNSPVAIRYPRGGDIKSLEMTPIKNMKKGKWEVICEEGDIAIIATGKMVQHAIIAREKLKEYGIKSTIVNANFINPIDKELIKNFVKKGYKIVTVEDNVIKGGFGSLVLQYISELKANNTVLNLGFKDKFVPHGSTDILYKIEGLDPEGIVKNIIKII